MPRGRRYLCIHGHFYQPPRENPWLEAIERQDAARPYHDWNERIEAECYGPNAAARILAADGRIERVVNNYERISFDFGPTLLSWLEFHAPATYRGVIEADRRASARFGGHGPAMAQGYNHTILPLCSPRDKVTQVRWGLADFRHRFGRDAEGMWLPETAVDLETLEVLAREGVRFTVLAPNQARRVRRIGDGGWTDVANGSVDTRKPYRVPLPSGRSIVAFFYDGPTSRAVAFERLLDDGASFAKRLLAGARDDDGPQLITIATDGESYGHHHRFGEMALAFALRWVEREGLAEPLPYAAFLERRPPEDEVQIVEYSSWSCAHGIERWRADCGCSTGANPGWNQAWRAPLRAALDRLRDAIDAAWEGRAAALLRGPWDARDAYVDVVLDRSPESLAAFFERHAAATPSEADRVAMLELLELQRHRMLMYTSCGWFFDDLSGIETVQVMQYAGRAVQLARRALGLDLEPELLEGLSEASSNRSAAGDGRRIYEREVRPAMVDLETIGAHHAADSLFDDFEDRSRLYVYDVVREDFDTREDGRSRLALGRLRITDGLTAESLVVSAAALHLGDHNLVAGSRAWPGDEEHARMVSELGEAFERADLPELLRLVDRHFPGRTCTLRSLFRDRRRRAIARILESTVSEAEHVLERLYRQHAPLMRYLDDLDVPLPGVLRSTAEFVLHARLREELGSATPDVDELDALVSEADEHRVRIDVDRLRLHVQRAVDGACEAVRADPADGAALERLVRLLEFSREPAFGIDLRTPWGLYGDLARGDAAPAGAAPDPARLAKLGEALGFRVGPA